MTNAKVEVRHDTLDVETYLRLRSEAGLSGYTEEAARKGLAGTIFAVVLLSDDATIGMGRIVGDGGCFFQIVDIAVDPAFQGQGLGKQIMSELIAYLETNAPSFAYVSLIADVPANKLYEQFGFRETAPGSVGMARRLQ